MAKIDRGIEQSMVREGYTEEEVIDEISRFGLTARVIFRTDIGGLDPFYHLYPQTVDLLNQVFQCREVPPRSQTRLQAINKSLSKKRWKAQDIFTWYIKHRAHLNWLLTSNTWPALKDSTSEMQVGDFTIINQTDGSTEIPVKMLEMAIKLIRASSIPGLSKVLYGDVFTVTSIANKRTMAAWYSVNKDNIWLILAKRFDKEKERALIHELGHRYWRKFAESARKDLWERHHSYLDGDNVMLQVGDNLPTTDYVIAERFPLGFRVVNSDGKTGFVDDKTIAPILRKLAFPTPYASTNSEEHFCEALSLYLMGNLNEPHLEAFEGIWL
jgi:hypothetical protein